jgi:hypothetical protein
MAGKWQKSGAGSNVDTGSGSKNGKGGGPANDQEKSHDVQFAKGGKTHMFGEQEANDQRPGFAEKEDARGPGAKFAEGGKGKMFGFAGAQPATAGISAARSS